MSDQTYTREDFLTGLKAAGLRQVEFAALCGLSATTVHHWGDGRNAFPAWVQVLVSTLSENRALRAAMAELLTVPRGGVGRPMKGQGDD